MNGTEYVIEQLGQALRASHQVVAEQAQRIATLEDAYQALLAESSSRQESSQ